ncbi:hypothetical protein GOP47_0014915 [Adiantum capillus-veneris]|uniref:Uncharacterized protein n=1 Tax=Adiantum capillus-veneris TaxID=13818 RepID=A0A9D4UN92_ADICA|nr:hypothetical protein GOP47_0014915 [Adiantum capillus-veneris]
MALLPDGKALAFVKDIIEAAGVGATCVWVTTRHLYFSREGRCLLFKIVKRKSSVLTTSLAIALVFERNHYLTIGSWWEALDPFDLGQKRISTVLQ